MYRFSAIKSFLLASVVCCLVFACKTDYEKLVNRELKSGVRHDSLFLGLSLGMSSKDFYTDCWELNKQKIIRAGSVNSSVLYEVVDLADTATMNFYPTFEDDSLYEMPVHIQYKGWAPWNKKLSNDSLLVDVVKLMDRWYGGNSIRVDFDDVGPIFVKLNGNRRISMGKEGENSVLVMYTDMLKEKRVKAKLKNEKK